MKNTQTPSPAAQATPTPWRVEPGLEPGVIEITTTKTVIAQVGPYYETADDAAANAALIVSSVNAHAALVARVAELESALSAAEGKFNLLANYGLPGDSIEVDFGAMKEIAADAEFAARAALKGGAK